MHVQNHCEECKYLYSLYFALGVGRLDGEEAERFWAEANQIAGSTKQMNPGHRVDTIDDMINDWNKTKQLLQGKLASLPPIITKLIYRQASLIQKRHAESMPLLTKFAKSFADFDVTVRKLYGREVVEGWVRAGVSSGKNADGTFFSAFKSSNPGEYLLAISPYFCLTWSLERSLANCIREMVLEATTRGQNRGMDKLGLLIGDGLILQQRQ